MKQSHDRLRRRVRVGSDKCCGGNEERASDEAAFITGQTIVVDGGQVLPESNMALEDL